MGELARIWFVAAALGCSSSPAPEPVLPPCDELEGAWQPLDRVASTLVGTIEPEAAPLAEPGALNPASHEGELNYAELGLGTYHRGPGLDRVTRTELGGTTDFATRRSLALFVQVADTQLVDDESPSRIADLDTPVAGGALRPQEGYVVHAMSAMNRTLARIEPADRPYDFGIVTGDCTDSAQYDELRWFIDTMDGQPGIRVDSGRVDDPAPGPDNDPKDAVDAVGFPAPWLFVFGNHDVALVGTIAVAGNEDLATGDFAPFGTRDYTQPFAPAVSRLEVVPDPDRRNVGLDDVVSELGNTAAMPGPVGHGFPAGASTALGANYEYDAIPNLLRIVHLDTADVTGGSPGIVMRAQIDNFLRPALDRAAADGVLVLLASHHPSDYIDQLRGESGALIPDAVPAAEVEALVASYPNVLAWLVGHIHDNRIRAIAGADVTHPGYWEIATSAIADWPNQTRVLELVDNGNGTLSLFATLIDYDEQTCAERRFRRLAVMDRLAGWAPATSELSTDRNVELVIPIPAGTAAAIAAATGRDRIDSETTLRGM